MVVSPKKILWPTDFSELSLHGGRYAQAFCDVFGAEMHVVHVVAQTVSPEMFVTLPADVGPAGAEPELVAAARRSVDQLIEEHFADVNDICCAALFGSPWYAICEYSRQQEIDLIVIATHGRTGLKHVLIGSTAERIVQHAPCPVLSVKSSERQFLTTSSAPDGDAST